MASFRSLLLVLPLAFACADARPALATPDRPIILVNSYPPNGDAELVGRTAANKMLKLMQTFAAPALTDVLAARAGDAMSLALDRIVTVMRRSHGRGIPGVHHVVISRPDGETLLFSSNIEILTQPRLYKVPYAPLRDLVPVAAVARMPVVMIAPALGGVDSVRAFVAVAQAAPGTLDYGSSGDFRSGHLAGELFNARAGLSVVHVSYNGGIDALSGVIKGQVAVAFVPLPVALPAIPGGKIRVLGIADPARHETLPQVPTIAEAGLRGFEAAAWYGMFAPARTPADVVMQLNESAIKGLRTTGTERLLLASGLQARYPSAAELAELLRDEHRKWTPVIDSLNPPY